MSYREPVIDSTEISDGEDYYTAVYDATQRAKRATAESGTEITWLADGDEPYGAIVSADVVKAARHFWAEITREIEKNRGLPKL